MKNDFAPTVGHCFNLRGEWGGVLDWELLAIEPSRTLSYTWNHSRRVAKKALAAERRAKGAGDRAQRLAR